MPTPVTGIDSITVQLSFTHLPNIGDSISVYSAVQPGNATNQTINWSSSDTSVFTVVNNPAIYPGGQITATGYGVADIIATTADGGFVARYPNFYVGTNAPTFVTGINSISAAGGATSVAVGSTLALSTSVIPGDAANKKITWSSSNTNYATVDISGVVTGVGNGSVTITATTVNGGYAETYGLSVTGGVPDTGVVITGQSGVAIGQTTTLTATVSPANAASKVVTWSSSSTSVATINSSGVVTGLTAGTTTITATTANNHTDTHVIAVSAAVLRTFQMTSEEPYNGNIAMSSSGQRQYYHSNNTGYLRISTNYGVSWTSGAYIGGAEASAVTCCSQSGQKVLVVLGGTIYISSDYGATFTNITSNINNNYGVYGDDSGRPMASMSANGATIAIVTYNNNVANVPYLAVSVNSGSSWSYIPIQTDDAAILYPVIGGISNMSDDGAVLYLAAYEIDGTSATSTGALIKYSWDITSAGPDDVYYVEDVTTGKAGASELEYRRVSMSNNALVITASSLKDVVVSDDIASTWSVVYHETQSPNIYDVCMSGNGDNIIFATSNYKLFYSSSKGSYFLSTTFDPAPYDGANYSKTAMSYDGAYATLATSVNVPVALFNVITPPPVVPCFPVGTKILTPGGYKPVETLKDGDLVVTSDRRQVPIKLHITQAFGDLENAPYLVPRGVISPNVPLNDICLSPWHAFQIGYKRWQKPAIAALYYKSIKQYDIGKQITYYHLETPCYLTDDLIAEGVVVESYADAQLGHVNPYTYNKSQCYFSRIDMKTWELYKAMQ